MSVCLSVYVFVCLSVCVFVSVNEFSLFLFMSLSVYRHLSLTYFTFACIVHSSRGTTPPLCPFSPVCARLVLTLECRVSQTLCHQPPTLPFKQRKQLESMLTTLVLSSWPSSSSSFYVLLLFSSSFSSASSSPCPLPFFFLVLCHQLQAPPLERMCATRSRTALLSSHSTCRAQRSTL